MSHPDTKHITARIQALELDELSAAAAVAATSFQREGFTRHTLDLSTARRRERFSRAGELGLLLYHYQGQLVLTARQGQHLTGVTIVKLPGAEPIVPWYRRVGAVVQRLPGLIGLSRYVRWRRMLKLRSAVKPPAQLPKPYYTLEILAVSPDFQGQGIGRLLLTHVHTHCDQDGQAAGIYLMTGDEHNTRIYHRFGYEVVAARQGGSFTVWHMFRPHPARDAAAFFAARREAALEQSPARWRRLTLPLLGVAGTLIGLTLLWHFLCSRDES